MFTRQTCQDLRQRVAEDIDILKFGEFLLKNRICKDFNRLQTLLNDAYLKADDGEPVPRNPFTAMSLRGGKSQKPDQIIEAESIKRPEPPEEVAPWPDRKASIPPMSGSAPPMRGTQQPYSQNTHHAGETAPHVESHEGVGSRPGMETRPSVPPHSKPSMPSSHTPMSGETHPATPGGKGNTPVPHPDEGHSNPHVAPAENIDEIRAAIRRRISSVEQTARKKREVTKPPMNTDMRDMREADSPSRQVHQDSPHNHPQAEASAGQDYDEPVRRDNASAPQQSIPPSARENASAPPPHLRSTHRLAEMETQAPFESPKPIKPATPVNKLSVEPPPYDLQVPDEWPDCEGIMEMNTEACRKWMVQLLLKAQKEGVSDVHVSAESRPFVRGNRSLQVLSEHVLSDKEAEKLNLSLLSEDQMDRFGRDHDLDYALALDEHHRYRVNLMDHMDGAAGTYRVVPDSIRSLDELGFGDVDTLRKILSYHNGLILVTGPVGAGKTVTLAALVDELNRTREDHLITVEAPIEIVQRSESCHITQREVGSHTKSFKSALKGALRQDPDIIVIGEMTNLETIEMAISASETGHLVIGTMHTSDAATTLNRLLDVFPAAQQTQIRAMVSESLKGILCQRLLPSTQEGVELAYELLLNNAAVGNLIREGKSEGLSNVMETGLREGMRLMDRSVLELWEDGRISDEVALENLTGKQNKNRVRNGGTTEEEVEEETVPPRKKKGFFLK